MKKVLVVGQTPPPFGGQAIMIENMLGAKLSEVRLYHVRMSFSAEMDEVGKFKPGKVFKLVQLIFMIYYKRFRYDIHTLYYPPAPPKTVPMLRDIVVLNATRWLFKTVIFHFHAAGISEMHGQLRGLVKRLYESAYFFPEVCIRLSEFNPEDGRYFKTKREFVIGNGLDDFAGSTFQSLKENRLPVLLSVGVLCESKGVLVLLESINLLAKKDYKFRIKFMGRFESAGFQRQVETYICENKLTDFCEFLGVLTGEKKNAVFAGADIFCFPTFFEAETFGLVAVEAMQFCLPVVASRWRGVSSVVTDGISGFLVPPRDAHAFADRLEILLGNPVLRKKMGKAGRAAYETNFTAVAHYKQLENVFSLT